MRYKITETEKNHIEGLYFDKLAKEELVLFCLKSKEYDLNAYFDKIYNEAIKANITFNVVFDQIILKYVPKDIDTSNAKIEFTTNEIIC